MASAYVGSPMKACHLSTGIWLVRMVERAPIAFLEDLVEVTTSTGVERFEAPIVENEELDAGETAQDAGIAAVTAGERELGEQLGDPLIKNRAVVAAGPVTQGTSKPRFAHAGRDRARGEVELRLDESDRIACVLAQDRRTARARKALVSSSVPDTP